MLRRIAVPFLTALLIAAAALGIIVYGKGYRPAWEEKKLTATGLLSATSDPNAAQVIINGKLKTATNSTLNLEPGVYEVKITKEGYFPWRKTIKISKEIVTQVNAVLFPKTPELRPLTNTGVLNPLLSFDGTKIAFSIPPLATPAGEPDLISKKGLWSLDLNGSNFPFSKNLRQIAKTGGNVVWSPDGKQIFFEEKYLLDSSRLNDPLLPIISSPSAVLSDFQKQKELMEKQRISVLKPDLTDIATSSMKILAFSPDETKILYRANVSAILPNIISPPLMGVNSTPEKREIEKGQTYVYDIKEDRNYEIKKEFADILSPLPFFSSSHLILIEKEAISLLEYDGTNKTAVYAGPFEKNFVFPWPDKGKIVILTSLNKKASPQLDLYAINLR